MKRTIDITATRKSAARSNSLRCLGRPAPACFVALPFLLACAGLAVGAYDDAPDTAHDCLVEPMTIAEIGSPVQGILARLLVDRSQSVVAGQPIAELESALERVSVEHAEARAAMQSEIAAREADLELARLDLDRTEDLHGQRLVPAQKLDEARARQRVAAAAVVQALESRQLLQLELRRARRLLEQRTLRSPVDGVVVERLAFPGEFIYDNPVMTIAALDPLRVEVVLPARLFGSLRPGQLARVFPEIGDDEFLLATIDVVDPLLDTRSGTFGVRLTLPNPERAVPGGQKCRIEFDDVPDDGARTLSFGGD